MLARYYSSRQVYVSVCHNCQQQPIQRSRGVTTHKSEFYRSGRTDGAGFGTGLWRGVFSQPVIRCVLTKLLYLQNKGTSFWNVVLNSPTWKIAARRSSQRQLSSTNVDGRCNKPSSVELSWQHLRRPTFDRRLCITDVVVNFDVGNGFRDLGPSNGGACAPVAGT